MNKKPLNLTDKKKEKKKDVIYNTRVGVGMQKVSGKFYNSCELELLSGLESQQLHFTDTRSIGAYN